MSCDLLCYGVIANLLSLCILFHHIFMVFYVYSMLLKGCIATALSLLLFIKTTMSGTEGQGKCSKSQGTKFTLIKKKKFLFH